MKLDLHILIVTLHIYFKFQANTFLVLEIFKFMFKFRNIFSQLLTLKCDIDLKPGKGSMGSAHPLVEVNI